MEAHAASSPLVAARLRRRLTLEEAAELHEPRGRRVEVARGEPHVPVRLALRRHRGDASSTRPRSGSRNARRGARRPAGRVGRRALVAAPLGDRRSASSPSWPRSWSSSLRPQILPVEPPPTAAAPVEKAAARRAAPRALGDPGRRLQRDAPRERRVVARQRDRRARLRDRRRPQRRPAQLRGDAPSTTRPEARRSRGGSPASWAWASPRSREATTRTGLVVIVGAKG